VLQQERDIRPPVEADVTAVPPRPQPEALAGRDEEVRDLPRQVRELVADVLVRPGAVDEDAAVRADAATEEAPGRGLDQRRLPGLECEGAQVLLADAGLR
jgi:hypothetical protein